MHRAVALASALNLRNASGYGGFIKLRSVLCQGNKESPFASLLLRHYSWLVTYPLLTASIIFILGEEL